MINHIHIHPHQFLHNGTCKVLTDLTYSPYSECQSLVGLLRGVAISLSILFDSLSVFSLRSIRLFLSCQSSDLFFGFCIDAFVLCAWFFSSTYPPISLSFLPPLPSIRFPHPLKGYPSGLSSSPLSSYQVPTVSPTS